MASPNDNKENVQPTSDDSEAAGEPTPPPPLEIRVPGPLGWGSVNNNTETPMSTPMETSTAQRPIGSQRTFRSWEEANAAWHNANDAVDVEQTSSEEVEFYSRLIAQNILCQCENCRQLEQFACEYFTSLLRMGDDDDDDEAMIDGD
jgi:hypothetical protein